MQYARFSFFGFSHVLVLALSAAIVVVLIMVARKYPGSRAERICTLMAAAIPLAGVIFRNVYRWWTDQLTLIYDLPMQLCDWAYTAVILALILRRQWIYEIAYFWGLAGTLQALITPDLAWDFPHQKFIQFFLIHAGIVMGVFYLTLGLRFAPRPGSVWRVGLVSQLFFAAAMLTNYLTGANYGYLMEKPQGGSILDYLGPWPWYLLGLELLGLISFLIYYSPFYFARRLGHRFARD